MRALAAAYTEQQTRQDHRAALICATLANCHRDPKKSRPFRPEQFMPAKPTNPEQLTGKVKAFTAAFKTANHPPAS